VHAAEVDAFRRVITVVPVAAVPAVVPAFEVRATWRRGYRPPLRQENGVVEVTSDANVWPTPLPVQERPLYLMSAPLVTHQVNVPEAFTQ
jgi:hypothetical protein